MLSSIAEIIRDLLIFVVMAALLITLVVVISKMPDSNPLKRFLTALSYRLGATLAAGAVAVPLEPIPVDGPLIGSCVANRTARPGRVSVSVTTRTLAPIVRSPKLDVVTASPV